VLGRREMPGAEWFPRAELSYAAHVFRGHDEADVAIVHASELQPQAELTWGELRSLAAAAAGLRRLGVGHQTYPDRPADPRGVLAAPRT